MKSGSMCALRVAASPCVGASLTELLAVVSVTALLVGQAIPACRDMLDRARVTTAATNFRISLAAARSAAIRRGQRVDLLPATPAGWHTGWRVIVDRNNNQRADDGEEVLRDGPALPPDMEVLARLTDGSSAYLAFDPSGRPRSASSATVPQFGSLIFRCGMQRRKLVIGFLGRVRLCDPDHDRSAC